MKKYGDLVYTVVYLTEDQFRKLDMLCNYFNVKRSALLRALLDEFIRSNEDVITYIERTAGGEAYATHERSGIAETGDNDK